jgi:hypothetical protein
MAVTYDCLATVTLSSTANTIVFSSISSAYTDLILVGRTSSAGANTPRFRLNGDSGTNYDHWEFYTSTSAPASNSSSGDTVGTFGFSFTTSAPATSEPGIFIANFADYSNTSKQKSVLVHWANRASGIGFITNNWKSTNAVTSITISSGSSFPSSATGTGSIFTLYGIKEA